MMRRRLAGDRGYSLPELLVTMTILSIVLTGVALTSVSVQRTARANTARVDDLGDARNAMRAVETTLHKAVRVTATARLVEIATPRELQFIAQPPAGVIEPTRFRYFIDANGDLVEERLQADAGSVAPFDWTGVSELRVLARNLDATAPLFTYFDLDVCAPDAGSCATLDATADGTTGLSDIDRNALDLVGVAVTVSTNTSPPVSATILSRRILLRNTNYVPGA